MGPESFLPELQLSPKLLTWRLLLLLYFRALSHMITWYKHTYGLSMKHLYLVSNWSSHYRRVVQRTVSDLINYDAYSLQIIGHYFIVYFVVICLVPEAYNRSS